MTVDKRMPIMVVDDYATMRRIIENLLRQLEFNNTVEAADGDEALAKLKKQKFGLIFSDWNMQPKTGIEFLRDVRADDGLKHIPFIMVTAESKTENLIAAKQAGVSNYIVKPFDIATLKAKMQSVLGAF